MDEFENTEQGHGFLIESPQYTTALAAAALPYANGASHKRVMSNFRHGAASVALLRDRGHARVKIDRVGAAVPWYSLTDEVDLRNARKGIETQVRLHEAAGAQQILAAAVGAALWRQGEEIDAFIAGTRRIPLGARGWKLFSAHQMGTCRMGTDRRTSVANPWGELHDVSGAWIGDGSAFPTASGTTPMITIMALAHRNAQAVAAAAPSTAATTAPH